MTLATKLTTVCPQCGEPVDLFLTKKQLKQILIDMKRGEAAQKFTVKVKETRLWK